LTFALRDAFRKMRKFLMTTKKLTEDEAISLITIGVDFGITQVVDGNWAFTQSSRRISSPAARPDP
jgi:acetamidase/formamidase